MTRRLEDNVAWISGGASGIGGSDNGPESVAETVRRWLDQELVAGH
ncbi:MAG: hypothetical protein MK171_08410 [Pirellulales bacterium]|nr:hypothetical protein [Pirellulales bacterium]